MDHTLEGASTADQPRPAPATLQPPSLQSVPQPPGIPSPMGAPPPMPYPYYPLVPNPNGGMAPPRPLYTQGAPYFTIVGENEPLPPPVSPIGAQFPPYGMPPFAGGVPPPLNPGAMAAYAFPAMLSGPGGPSGIHGGPTSSFVRPYNQSATPISELGLGQLVNGRGQAGEEDLSPKAIRKLSHNAVEARCPLPTPPPHARPLVSAARPSASPQPSLPLGRARRRYGGGGASRRSSIGLRPCSTGACRLYLRRPVYLRLLSAALPPPAAAARPPRTNPAPRALPQSQSGQGLAPLRSGQAAHAPHQKVPLPRDRVGHVQGHRAAATTGAQCQSTPTPAPAPTTSPHPHPSPPQPQVSLSSPLSPILPCPRPCPYLYR